MTLEPTNSKVSTSIGIIFGFLNAIVWVLLFDFLVPKVLGVIDLIWWIVFCFILNISISFRISQQRTRHFQRLFWTIGIALFTTIFCAFVLGLSLAYNSGGGDYSGLVFLAGGILGGLIGLIIGIVVGVKTSPSNISKINVIQQVVEGIITSIVIGMSISILFSIAVTNSLIEGLIFSPLGAIPSVITGLTTALAIYVANRWSKRKHAIPSTDVG